jgi:N-carbamoyl-L-amino-acid hydrolase
MSRAEQAERLASLISEDRLWRHHLAMAEIGAIENGGVNRQTLTMEDIAARNRLVTWALDRGYEVEVDHVANLFFHRTGRDNGLPSVATGSHIDTQPQGGRFDGIYGVLAGLEVFEALDKGNIETDHPLVVIAWTNEEGSRFSPGAMGSTVFSGVRELEEFHDVVDGNGVRFVDALKRTLEALPNVPLQNSRPPLKAYLEAHIEQGPVLEDEDITIGAVAGIQGARWFEVEVFGRSAHAGTTPMAARQDALMETIRAINLLRETMHDPSDQLRFTVGRMDVSPNSPNTIPDKVRFSIDLRHPEATVLNAKSDAIEGLCCGVLESCTLKITETFHREPCTFPEHIIAAVEKSAQVLSLRSNRMTSGAFHDALFLAEICPTGMIFVPSVKGISHHPSEYTQPDDLAAGARVLGATLIELARATGNASMEIAE